MDRGLGKTVVNDRKPILACIDIETAFKKENQAMSLVVNWMLFPNEIIQQYLSNSHQSPVNQCLTFFNGGYLSIN